MLSHFMPLTMPCYSPTMSSPTTVSIDQSRFCPLKPRSNALPDTRLPHTFKLAVAVPSEILLRFCLIWPLFMFYFVFQLSVPLLLLYTWFGSHYNWPQHHVCRKHSTIARITCIFWLHGCRDSEQASPKCVTLTCELFCAESNLDPAGSQETFASLK